VTTETDGRAAAGIDALADGFWESILELSPTMATVYGDERYADRLEDPGPAGRAKTRALMEGTLASIDAIDPDRLPTEQRITRDMLRIVADIQLEQLDQRIDVLKVVDQMDGPQTILPTLGAFQPADTPERLEKLIARLHAYGPFMAANAELLREGMARGLTAPRIVAERTVAQLERILAAPVDAYPLVESVQLARDADRERVAEAVRDVVRPADATYLAVLRDEYLPTTRTDPGLWSAPDGDALYRTQIRAWTTLDIEPEELHRVGLEELESIEAERRVIARRAGFGDDTVAYRAALSVEPANVPPSPEALLARATDDIGRALDVAPSVFGRLPSAGCVVRAVEAYKEKDAPFAYYFPPAIDGSRPGIYYANTYDLPSRVYTKLASTTYHEAVPGHHFQIALEMENPSLGTFRRLGSRLVGGAYVEGWGLYAERLADELGLYRDEAERFGMLDGQAWRAARLVVDTGVHALRWSRDRSIETLKRAGLSDTDAVIETDRYICWPGQALSYKVGQREIERLRRELTARDGAAFDLRRFHDETLGHGSLPLATLAAELPRWLSTAG
jgi:uncharacterized protein (DUF885 family)